MERAIQVSGSLAAQENSTLSAKVPGRLQSLSVDVGSRIQTGDLLAQVDPRDYELSVQQARALLGQARAALGLPLEGDADSVDLQNISTVKQASAILAEATKNRDRVANLAKAGIAPESEHDQVQANYTVALARQETAVEDGRTRMAALAARRAGYEIARKQLADSAIRAPFDGAVQERLASVGEYVAAGTPVLRLVKTDPLRLRLEVHERESLLVATGQIVRLWVEGSPNVHTGKIARLSPALVELNRMLLVEADVPNRGELRPGLFARAHIIVDQQKPGLSVPASALVTFAGIEKVVEVRDHKALEKNVVTGRRGPGWIEIVAGLSEGAMVMLDPGGLRTGQTVKVEPATAESIPVSGPITAVRKDHALP
jgi:RND family efflux transporter MFP subunit